MISIYTSTVETEEDRLLVEIIYTRYYALMCSVAQKHLSNKSDIEDAVHDAMLKIIDNLHILDGSDERRLRAYCAVVAKNKAIDYTRKKSNKALPIEEVIYEEDTSPDVGEIVDSAEGVRIVLREIKHLPEKYKNVCTLKFVCEMSASEIASSLDITETTVNVRLTRARKMLSESLRREFILK